MNDSPQKKHILIINQHGENRGDESAMRAMLNGLEHSLGNVKFTVIVQFQDTTLQIPFNEDVTMLHMKMSVFDFMRLVTYGLLSKIGLSFKSLLNTKTKPIIQAYESSELVISAPGGPYFGDIYYKHEIVHWYYVWLAKAYKKPLFLYSPSAGPFKNVILNPVRKYLFKAFDVLCVREEISAKYLEDFLGDDTKVNVTADSAIQQVLPAFDKNEYFKDNKKVLNNKLLVSVSAIQYRFPNETDADLKRERYTEALLQCLKHLNENNDCHFLLFPQLYGKIHSDLPYLNEIAGYFPDSASWEIINPDFDSDMQRKLFAMTDICIASRYHPQIFSGSSGVPGICIYYEHKALGFMSFLGLEDFAFNIRDLNAVSMCAKLDEAIERREEISALMQQNIIPIRERAKQSTKLATDLYYKNI